jgi:toxin CcdB
MAQFTVHRNAEPTNRSTVPFLLDVQSDLLSELSTRAVVPLYTAAAMKGRVTRTLTPQFEIEGRQVVMVTPQIAGVALKMLGPAVGSLAAERAAILAALDLLITGI